MEEIGPGKYNTEQKKLPEDAVLYETTTSYAAYISKEKKALVIQTKEYHPGNLCISEENLEQILKEISQKK